METVYTTWGKSSICSAMVGPLGAMCGRPAPPLLSLWMVARSVSHGCQVGAAVSAPFLSLPPLSIVDGHPLADMDGQMRGVGPPCIQIHWMQGLGPPLCLPLFAPLDDLPTGG